VKIACALVLAVSACSADAGELRRVEFDVETVGLLDFGQQPVVHTALGWDVTLTAAELSVAALYFRNTVPGSGTSDDQGRVVAQVLGPFTIDALDPSPARLPVAGIALTERVRSAELWLTEADSGPIVDAVGPALAHVAGVARQGDEEIAFDGGLMFPERSDSRAYEAWQNRRLRRLEADFVPGASGVLRLSVDPSRFFDAVQFEMLGPATGSRDFASDADQLQLRSGIAGTANYRFDFAAP
jgi:hypothetical protein